MASLPERIARRAFRPFYRPYYRFLWRRRFPGGDALERLVRRFEDASRRADVPIDGEAWDAQYAAGRWDFLTADEQLERFRAIAELVRRHAPGAAVLDVGCGEGVLRDVLGPEISYLGIDLSREAIERARARAAAAGDAGARFEIADAESWRTDRRFGAVVLNECLYYLRRPLAAAHRYLGSVEPGGVMVVSMFRGPRADAIGRRLDAAFPPLETLELDRARGGRRITVHRRGH